MPHTFPKPHTDLLEQFIDYRVPVDKYDELAAYAKQAMAFMNNQAASHTTGLHFTVSRGGTADADGPRMP